jgi:hypothetical protein
MGDPVLVAICMDEASRAVNRVNPGDGHLPGVQDELHAAWYMVVAATMFSAD